jgi:drug/metabolite transporter (DMT)-like permease
LLQNVGVRAASSMVCAGWAVLCGGFSWLDSPGAQHQWRETLLSGMLQTLLTAALIVLTVWLLGRWTPAQVSARYLAVPLITLVEGAGLLRPAFTWTLVVGLLMMAASVGLLLREEPADSADAHPDLLSPR